LPLPNDRQRDTPSNKTLAHGGGGVLQHLFYCARCNIERLGLDTAKRHDSNVARFNDGALSLYIGGGVAGDLLAGCGQRRRVLPERMNLDCGRRLRASARVDIGLARKDQPEVTHEGVLRIFAALLQRRVNRALSCRRVVWGFNQV